MSDGRKKVYIPKPIKGVAHIPLLIPYFGEVDTGSKLFFDNVFSKIGKVVEKVNDITQSDYILLPHNYFSIKRNTEYLRGSVELSKRYAKPIILFAYGDSDEVIDIPNAIIFRASVYRSRMRKNEVVMPAYAQDLGNMYGVNARDKTEKPVVGFCGWADFDSNIRKYKALTKDACYNMCSLFSNGVYWQSKRNGVLLRKKVLTILKKSNTANTNFIIRDSFSRNKKTIKIDPDVARDEYVDVIKHSDIGLSVKGDGNFSVRFYEILSMGRIPLLIDTDTVLPLERHIRYDDFVIKVPLHDIGNVDTYIRAFWGGVDGDAFIDAQRKARDAFERYLRIDKFFEFAFTHIDLIV